MRLVSLDLGIAKDNGLQPITMRPLGNLVVLAGPNGAGKSRILQLVQAVLSDQNLYSPHIDSIRAALAAHRSRQLNYSPEQVSQWEQLDEKASKIFLDSAFHANLVANFFPKSIQLNDSRQMSDAGMKQASAQLVSVTAMNQLSAQALAYLTTVERRWFSATHQSLNVDPSERESAIQAHVTLGDVIEELLGVRPGFDLDQQPTLFGRPVVDAKLSAGQNILLQIAIALHGKGTRLGDLVLLLDEPESYLHPAAVLRAINKLRTANSMGQVWVATHCVPVLAAMPTDSIWYVREGSVAWAGRSPELVLEGLLGGPEGREQMEEFLRLPAQFASNRFAAQCLVAPTAVDTGPDDPQAKQLRDFCLASAAGKRLRILDFGAGQGRLLSALHERWRAKDEFANDVDYLAYEPFQDSESKLTKIISAIYGDKEPPRVFADEEALTKLDQNSVDVVVMCNVLHEIPPEDWKRIFGQAGLIRFLKPTGHLLVLEDMEVPHGEKAHRFGFLLLDDVHLYSLLRCRESDPVIASTAAREGRLRAHAIPAGILGRATHDSTLTTLGLLQRTARTEIKKLRAAALSPRNGRLHALWTQLLANADLGLSGL